MTEKEKCPECEYEKDDEGCIQIICPHQIGTVGKPVDGKLRGIEEILGSDKYIRSNEGGWYIDIVDIPEIAKDIIALFPDVAVLQRKLSVGNKLIAELTDKCRELESRLDQTETRIKGYQVALKEALESELTLEAAVLAERDRIIKAFEDMASEDGRIVLNMKLMRQMEATLKEQEGEKG